MAAGTVSANRGQYDSRRQAFVFEFLKSGQISRASELAGFVSTYGYQLLQEPRIAAELRVALDRAKAEDVVLARAALRTIAQDERFPAGARVTAARTLLEYAGAMRQADSASTKDPSEMTTEELRAMVSSLDAELGNRAKPVGVPDSAPIPTELAEIVA